MRPTIIRIGSLFSIIGAIIALVIFGKYVAEDKNLAHMLCMILIAVLFFVTAGFFYSGGVEKSQGIALAMIGITAAIIISIYILVNDALPLYGFVPMLVCIIIAGLAATTPESNRWFSVESR